MGRGELCCRRGLRIISLQTEEGREEPEMRKANSGAKSQLGGWGGGALERTDCWQRPESKNLGRVKSRNEAQTVGRHSNDTDRPGWEKFLSSGEA